MIEEIAVDGRILAYIISRTWEPDRTTFLTPPEDKQQVGFVVYPAGGVIPRHVHKNQERRIVGTSEVLFVRRGRGEVDIYADDKALIATRTVMAGDVLILVSGGHGFRIEEDAVFVEVKQGPYLGVDDKERF